MNNIYRCVNLGETTHLALQDQALIVDEKVEALPEGYGLYLVSDKYNFCENVQRLPNDCKSGSFVLKTEESVILLESSDIPDRVLFTTGLCNSNCIMCPYTEHFRLNSKLEPLSMLKRFIDLMNPNAEYVCVTGGEPTLLRNNFLKLIEHFKNHFYRAVLHILTNGRTFAYKNFLTDFQQVRPYKTLLGIPIHAANADLHDYISQAKGSFNETLRGLDNLYAFGEYIELRIVTSKLNYTNLPNLAKFIAKRYPYCQHVCMMGLEMMGNAMINRDKVWCNYSEIWPFIREATDILVTNGVEVELYNYPLCSIDHRLQPLYRKSITPSKIEFLPECETCRRKSECGGFFRTTKVMSDITVTPY